MVVWFLARVPCDVVLKGDFYGFNHTLDIGLNAFLIKIDGKVCVHVMINLG